MPDNQIRYACYLPYEGQSYGDLELQKGLIDIYNLFFSAGKVIPQKLDCVSRCIVDTGEVITRIYLVDFFTGKYVHHEV